MEIAPLLQVGRGITALIGGGGKTTLLYTLAEELRRQGTVIVTTSTHIKCPERYPVLLNADGAEVKVALAEHGAVCVAGESGTSGKLTAPAQGFDALAALADFVLVEADGAKRLPLKAHAPYEPVIPPNTAQTIYVVGADGFGRTIREICHRSDRYAALCGASEADVVTPALEARVLLAEGYGGGWFYINKVETRQDWLHAKMLAAMLPGITVAGSLWRGEYQRIS